MSQPSDPRDSERTALCRNSVLPRPWGSLVYGADEPGVGMPCLFLHGHGGDRRDFARLLVRLPEVRAVAMDFAGHRESSMPPSMTLSGLAEDAVALLDPGQRVGSSAYRIGRPSSSLG